MLLYGDEYHKLKGKKCSDEIWLQKSSKIFRENGIIIIVINYNYMKIFN